MAIYTIFVFIAIVAQLCSGSGRDHASEVTTFVKRHSDVMTKEIEQRLNQGFKRSMVAHRSKKMMFELIPSTEPTSPPTDASTTEDVPTIAPTAEPTENPDLSSTGYYYLTYSFSSDCSSPVVSVGFSVNTCLKDKTSAYKIRIVDDDWANAYIDRYGDSQCQQLIEGGVEFTQDEKCQVTDSGVVTDPTNPTGKVYSQMFITTASTPPRLGDAGGGLIETFEGSTCSESAVQSYLQYAANVCISSGKDLGAFYVACSADEDNMIMVVDADDVPNCAGKLASAIFPSGCRAGVSSDDDADDGNDGDDAWHIDDATDDVSAFDDDYFSEPRNSGKQNSNNNKKTKRNTKTGKKGQEINPSPSVSTTPFQTSLQTREVSQRATCQAPNKAIAFKVTKQIISDFSETVYDSDTELYGNTLKQTIASTMADVQPSGITDLTVVDTAAARTSARAIRRALQASSVTLTYTVSGVSRYSSSQLADQLQAALVSGAFDSALHLFAAENGATGLLNATSNSVETDIGDGSDDETLSTGAIVGIVIGCVAFLVIVGVLIWYFCRSKGLATRDSAGGIAL